MSAPMPEPTHPALGPLVALVDEWGRADATHGPCATCHGRGVWMDEPCSECDGPLSTFNRGYHHGLDESLTGLRAAIAEASALLGEVREEAIQRGAVAARAEWSARSPSEWDAAPKSTKRAYRQLAAAVLDAATATPRCQHVSPSPWGPTQCALLEGHEERHAYDPSEDQP